MSTLYALLLKKSLAFFKNSVDPQKPADQDPHCISSTRLINSNNEIAQLNVCFCLI